MGAGVRIENSSYNSVANVAVSRNGYGIYIGISQSDNNRLDDIRALNNANSGIVIDDSPPKVNGLRPATKTD